MNTKKLSITIGIILVVAFFASLIAALSNEEENENKLKAGTEKEYNCATQHAGDHFKKGHKLCCNPEKCRAMKCDTSMCKLRVKSVQWVRRNAIRQNALTMLTNA